MNSRRRIGLLWLLLPGLIIAAVASCARQTPAETPSAATTPTSSIAHTEKAVVNSVSVIHVFVALADNVNQGIVPVSATLGNGDNATTNLYWGAAFGVRTFFTRNKDWELISVVPNPSARILERCVFKHRRASVLLVADAY